MTRRAGFDVSCSTLCTDNIIGFLHTPAARKLPQPRVWITASVSRFSREIPSSLSLSLGISPRPILLNGNQIKKLCRENRALGDRWKATHRVHDLFKDLPAST